MNLPAANHQTSIRVVKIGGSLLESKDSPVQISRWLERQPKIKTVWIVGGGQRVDSIRRWDQMFCLNSEEAHWICISLMDLNSQLVQTWFPDWDTCEDMERLTTETNVDNVNFKAGRWLKQNADLLPCSWDTTSDSISAQLAKSIGASELVLLKSSMPPEPTTVHNLSSIGYLDCHFPNVLENTPLRLVNVRDPAYPEMRLQEV